VASLYGLRRTDNHPGLSASSPALNLPSTRISLAASARQKVCPHPKVRTADTALSFAALRRLAPVEAFDRQPHPATSAYAFFSIAVSLSGHRSPFWLAQHCFQCLARCCHQHRTRLAATTASEDLDEIKLVSLAETKADLSTPLPFSLL
jgi:alpha-beta hydrolase superfamily lysophospholipase